MDSPTGFTRLEICCRGEEEKTTTLQKKHQGKTSLRKKKLSMDRKRLDEGYLV